MWLFALAPAPVTDECGELAVAAARNHRRIVLRDKPVRLVISCSDSLSRRNIRRILPSMSMVINGAYTAWAPAGTAFDPDSVQVTYHGKAGDINMINLSDLIKEAYEYPDFERITEFFIDPASTWLLGGYSVTGPDPSSPNILGLTEVSLKGQLALISTLADGTTRATFDNTGIFYSYRHITDNEVNTLRAGGRLNDLPPRTVSFRFEVVVNGIKEWRAGSVTIDIKDVASSNSVFFGDRPLDNPGYSDLKLSGTVVVGHANSTLDVYRIEQRLKYLGFPALKTGLDNAIKEFDVNGIFGTEDKHALKLFEKVVRYGPGNRQFASDQNGADGQLLNDVEGKKTLEWLSAYNAPHWMAIFDNQPVSSGVVRNPQLPAWVSTQIESGKNDVERYGTSWLRDLMRAKSFAPEILRGYREREFRFTAATDANHGFTPGEHKSRPRLLRQDFRFYK